MEDGGAYSRGLQEVSAPDTMTCRQATKGHCQSMAQPLCPPLPPPPLPLQFTLTLTHACHMHQESSEHGRALGEAWVSPLAPIGLIVLSRDGQRTHPALEGHWRGGASSSKGIDAPCPSVHARHWALGYHWVQPNQLLESHAIERLSSGWWLSLLAPVRRDKGRLSL